MPLTTEKKYINEIKANEDIFSIFLLSKAEQAQAKNGMYWRIELKDATGSIEGKIWSPLSSAFSELPVGQIVEIKAKSTTYRDKIDLNIEALAFLSEEETAQINLADFIESSTQDPELMLTELKELCKTYCYHKPLKKFLLLILKDEEITRLLKTAPAAKSMHHAFAGGLLEHTLSVTKLCLKISEQYPQLDKQILLAGAICHDLGKMWEMSGGLSNEYTDEGLLIGHIQIIIEKLEPFLKKSGLETALALHLKHLILSHHGYYEFGAPKLPQTAEALILHYADNIDAKMDQVKTALNTIPETETGWSKYLKSLERSVYKAEQTPQALRQNLETQTNLLEQNQEKNLQCALPFNFENYN
ncbi:3'-5' exoribonuclease YhaM family protein [Desulfovibrio litoralis]|uniref:3'-5' exoribonuclease n=1 Tax=Desulfovibrio litoralis DSM 11393 TaxID=1121455 RepID=A0A1M7TBD7_9BACT|nr:HD domain-containing protein [Desulfovibrio litoralis]SHN68013.1 3'-5' exoribonuclease [Desulfovibrio litoralis DSM 11393]